MKKIFFLTLIIFALLAWRAEAKINGCDWVINANCSDIHAVPPTGTPSVDCGPPNTSSQNSFSTYKCCCGSQVTGCCETRNRNTNEITARDGMTETACQSNATWAEITTFSTTMRAVSNRCTTPPPPAGGGCCLCSYSPDPMISTVFYTSFTDPDRATCNDRAGFGSMYQSCSFTPGQRANSTNGCEDAPVETPPVDLKTEEGSPQAPAQARGEAKLTLDPIDNPLKVAGAEGVSTVIGRVISSLFSILGTITVLMIIYGGWLWMTAQGNDAKVAQSRKILTWAFLGVTLIFVAYILVRFVFEISTSL